MFNQLSVSNPQISFSEASYNDEGLIGLSDLECTISKEKSTLSDLKAKI